MALIVFFSELKNGLLFFQRQLSGLHVGLSFLTQCSCHRKNWKLKLRVDISNYLLFNHLTGHIWATRKFQSREMLTAQSANCGVRQTRAKRQKEQKENEQRRKERASSLNGILYPTEMFIGGIGLQRPHSPVLGGILGNVVFCWNMAATCSPYTSIRWSRPVPLVEKHPQSIRFPPPCFTVGMVFLGLYSAFLFLQTRRVELMPNSSILVSSDHITFSQASSGSSRCSLAHFRRACTCAFFSRGTLHVQQDFNPSRCSVFLMVLFVTVVPTAFRSLTISSCVVLGWSLTFLIIFDIPRGEILRGAPDRGRGRGRLLCDFVFLPFSNNRSNSC